MVNVIYAAHRKGGREYIWRIPENMQVNVQDWAVVRTQYGICIVQVQRLGEVEDAEAEKLESVLQAVSDRTMLPMPEPKKKSSARKRRKRAARAAEKEKKRWAESGMDITPYWNKGFTTPQLDEIRKGLLIGIDISQYADPTLLPGKMKKKRWAMIRPLAKFMGYMPDGLSKEQAKEILLGIESRVDVKQYADPSLSWKMMRLLRRCMEAGLDGAELKGKTHKELAACLRAQTDTGAGKAAGAETKAEETEPSSVSEPAVEKTEPGSENAKPVHRRGEAESIIRAYQAAHPQATRNEAARATGYTWATANKYWV